MRKTQWAVTAWFALLRVDIACRRRGFDGVCRLLKKMPPEGAHNPHIVRVLTDATALAACFYWKPVLCLQRSAALVYLLRRQQLPARLVIGYRPSPFSAHAWVELAGRVINDSPEYAKRMTVLMGM